MVLPFKQSWARIFPAFPVFFGVVKMQQIALAKAAPGMILAQDVRLDTGLVQLKEGMALTAESIDSLRSRGVSTISVVGDAHNLDDDVGILREMAENLPYLFRRQKDDVFMMTLCGMFTRHLSQRIAGRQALEDAVPYGDRENDDRNSA
jgi:hypothetical protein